MREMSPKTSTRIYKQKKAVLDPKKLQVHIGETIPQSKLTKTMLPKTDAKHRTGVTLASRTLRGLRK